MNNRTRFSLLLVIAWMMLMLPAMAFAQVGGPAPDDDGDGIPNDIDVCPQQAGPREFNGCPDSDGDGTSDNIDACPTQGGPDFNRGCPVEQPAENPVPENRTNPVRPVVGGDCTLATFLTTAVNVREYPASDAPVLATLDPNVLYPVLGMQVLPDSTWYLVETGWVNGIAVVLGGDCGGATRVHVYPDFGILLGNGLTETTGDYCFKVGTQEICLGRIDVLVNTPDNSENKPAVKKVCKGIKGKIICFVVEEIISAIWDWWNDDDGATIDPTTNPDILIFDDPTPDDSTSGAKKICKGIKGKIVCFLVEEVISWIIDWWNEDDSNSQTAPIDLRELTSTILIPARSENVGDPRTTVGNEYPWCHDILKDIIIQHTPSDGTSPVQSEIMGDYLVTYLVLNPDIPLPQQQPCKKWVDGAANVEDSRSNLGLGAYMIEYDSWPPHGWNTDILGGNSTVPIMALLLPAVQKVREAAYVSPMDGALVIDFLGNSTVDENGGVFVGLSKNARTVIRLDY